MSITQTYFLAHSARGKLSREAARADHDLRLLVGHANMLDSLMIDLANAEQEQERWFNKSLSGAREQEEEISHPTTIVEEPEADWEVEDAEASDDDSEYEEEQIKPAQPIESTDDMDFDDEEDEGLTLTRTKSRHSPPELTLDSDSDSEDEHMPPSPTNLSLESLTTQQKQPIDTSAFFPVLKDEFQISSRREPTIIAAY